MIERLGRRKFLMYGSAALGTSLLLKACTTNDSDTTSEGTEGSTGASSSEDTIKVGILHSLSGTMAISETTVVDAEKLAIKEINESGGISGGALQNRCVFKRH